MFSCAFELLGSSPIQSFKARTPTRHFRISAFVRDNFASTTMCLKKSATEIRPGRKQQSFISATHQRRNRHQLNDIHCTAHRTLRNRHACRGSRLAAVSSRFSRPPSPPFELLLGAGLLRDFRRLLSAPIRAPRAPTLPPHCLSSPLPHLDLPVGESGRGDRVACYGDTNTKPSHPRRLLPNTRDRSPS